MAHRKHPPTPFARAVRDARDRAGLTQAKLAMALGVAPSTIYRIEQGHAPAGDVERKLRRWCRDLPEVVEEEPAATGTEG